jgi:hypothetical protein
MAILHGRQLQNCSYCGEVAETVDHVLPRSFRVKVMSAGMTYTRDLPDTVPACRECNCLASDHVFSTLREKRAFVQSALRRRYAKLLAAPPWRDEELATLGYVLATRVRSLEMKRRVVARRVRYAGPMADEPQAIRPRARRRRARFRLVVIQVQFCLFCDRMFRRTFSNRTCCSEICKKGYAFARIAVRGAMIVGRCSYCGASFRYDARSPALNAFCSTGCANRGRHEAPRDAQVCTIEMGGWT